MNKCLKCDLSLNRINVLDGFGNVDGEIVILSDYPRAYESKKGIAFSNKAYIPFMNNLNIRAGINENNAYFTYLLKCPLNVSDMDYHKDIELRFRLCSNHNLEIPKLSNVKLIVCLGKFVSEYIINNFMRFTPSMDKIANTYVIYGKYIYYFMYHPTFLKHNTDKINDYGKLCETIRRYVNPYYFGNFNYLL